MTKNQNDISTKNKEYSIRFCLILDFLFFDQHLINYLNLLI